MARSYWWKKSCTTWDVKKSGKYRINYQPQLVSRISSVNSIIIIPARKKVTLFLFKMVDMASWLNVNTGVMKYHQLNQCTFFEGESLKYTIHFASFAFCLIIGWSPQKEGPKKGVHQVPGSRYTTQHQTWWDRITCRCRIFASKATQRQNEGLNEFIEGKIGHVVGAWVGEFSFGDFWGSELALWFGFEKNLRIKLKQL